jgi:CRP/FNR family transcriptional regulator, cyclic AMP receptor protein
MLKQELVHFPLFQGLSEDQLRLLEPLLEYCSFPVGTTIFDQGAPADCLFFLLVGTVEVIYKPYDGPALPVARITSGGVFGWSAALGRDVYTSAALTAETVEAYRVNGQKLHSLCERYPETGVVILERLASIIADRLSSTHDQILAVLQSGIDCGENSGRSKK